MVLLLAGAFGKIVSSFVSDVLMPPLGLLLGKVDFSNLFINLSGGAYPTLKAAKEAGAVTLNYGAFINTIIDFLIVAFAIYLLIVQLNRFKREPEKLPPTAKECPFCFSSIPVKAIRCPQCTSALEK